MSNKIKSSAVTDMEVLTNTCLVLLTMLCLCNDDEYRYFLREAYNSLNDLVYTMKSDDKTSVCF